MFDLWLTCYHHKDNARWKSQTSYWGIDTIITAWRYGYRRFRISRQPFDLDLIN